MRMKRKAQKGQAIVEYVILIVVVVLAALLMLTAFSDRVRDMIGGITDILGGDSDKGGTKSSSEIMKDLKPKQSIEDLK